MTPRLPFLAVLALTVGGVAQTSSQALERTDQPAAGASTGAVGAAATAAVSTARPETAHGSVWYCAGGDTVVVANPTGHDVKATLGAYRGDIATAPGVAAGAPRTGRRGPEREVVERSFDLPARDRRRFRLDDLVPGEDQPAAVVELSGGGVVVEQEIDRPEGSDVAPCATVTAPEWHLAWGDTTRGARQLVVLFNPFGRDVAVDAHFSVRGGVREPVRWQGLVVPARRAVAVDLGQDVSRQEQVSTTVRSRGGHLVVSRVASYEAGDELGGVSLAPGEPGAATRWVFAHGRIDDRTQERIVLYNPGQKVAEVEVALDALGSDATPPHPFGVVVRPGGFETVDYADESRVEPGVAHATVVRSRNGVPVVAERVLTFEGDGGSGGEGGGDGDRGGEATGEVSAGPGTTTASARWAFPALLAGDGSEARVVVVNPDRSHAARVSVAVDHAGARSWPPDLHQVKVVPGGRTTLPLEEMPEGASIEVLADRPVVAERIVVRDHQVLTLTAGVPVPES